MRDCAVVGVAMCIAAAIVYYGWQAIKWVLVAAGLMAG